jgi:glycosyltransferase involved in cell wall biosynthesis
MANIKKLFFFMPDFFQAGGQRVVSDLSLNLPENIEQTIVLFEKKISFPHRGNIISLNAPLSSNFFKRFFYFFVRLYRFKKLVKKENPDWVISLGNSANIINILSTKNSIVRVDMFLSKEKNGFFGFLFRILIKTYFNKSSKIVTVSRASAKDLIDNFGIKKEKIITIYNPIDVKKIQELAKEDIESKYREIFKNPAIITSGRITEQKGQWHLIRAFVEAKNKIKDLKLIIMGEGELSPYIKELIDKYDLKEDVFLIGWQKNPFKFIAMSKLFVLPSLWEGLPMVLMEAMACGVPVISCDFKSGAREILAPQTDFNFETKEIEYARYGILTPVCDGKFYKASDSLTKEENNISKAMLDILNDRDKLQNFNQASLERAQDFDVEIIIKQWDFLLL